ncbi:MAG: hypothetical protein KatS3mg016_0334 [Fimbriimonadales bacterium]|nr:MAG: hypothetical protein KatS3mg016_0334 [Fimbriimonadales bacterium]
MRTLKIVSQQVSALFEQEARPENQMRYDPELWNYYPQLRSRAGCEQETRYVYDLCRLADFDPEGKRVLDAGCGLGLQLIVLHLMGASEAHGFDISESRLTTFQRLIEGFQLRGVHAQLASLEAVDYAPESFDMIVSNEAISHYSDVDRFLERAARWLRRGEVLIIADGNNGANPRLVEMTRPIILQAVEHYLKTDTPPTALYAPTQCPVNPCSGAVLERLFHPMELAHHLKQFGFRTRAYAYFGGAGGNPVVRLANALLMRLTPLTLRWAKSFRVVAVRV